MMMIEILFKGKREMEVSNRRKKHHVVPQFLLRGFTGISKQLFEFDLHLLTVCKKSPGQVAHVGDIYTIETEAGSSDEVEIALSNLESDVSRIIANISQLGQEPTETEWGSILLFVAVQKHRVPAIRNHFDAFTREVEKLAEQIALSQNLDVDTATEHLRAELEFTRSNNFANPIMLRSALMVARLLERRGRTILFESKGMTKSLVISDNPMVIYDMRKDARPPNRPLLPYGEDSAIFLPLTSSMVFASFDDSKLSGLFPLQDSLVGKLNRMQIRNSERRIFGPKESFCWGNFEGRELGWDDFVADQEEARTRTGWKPEWMK